MVLYYIFLYLAWNSCIKSVPHQLTVILGLVSTKAVFWEIISRKSGRDKEWAHRYNLEDSLMEIYSKEEEFWRRRGSMNWVLFGDANTAYFQAIANGRRRRCSIPLLWEGGQLF